MRRESLEEKMTRASFIASGAPQFNLKDLDTEALKSIVRYARIGILVEEVIKRRGACNFYVGKKQNGEKAYGFVSSPRWHPTVEACLREMTR